MQQQQHCQQPQLPPDHDDSSLKKMAAAVPHCGSANVLGGPVEGNCGNYSVNGSTSGSKHGSNGQNESSTADNDGGINVEIDNGIAGKHGSGDCSGSGSGDGGDGNSVDQNNFSLREAALTKFRQRVMLSGKGSVPKQEEISKTSTCVWEQTYVIRTLQIRRSTRVDTSSYLKYPSNMAADNK